MSQNERLFLKPSFLGLDCRLWLPSIYYRTEKIFFLNPQSKISSFFQNLLVNLT